MLIVALQSDLVDTTKISRPFCLERSKEFKILRVLRQTPTRQIVNDSWVICQKKSLQCSTHTTPTKHERTVLRDYIFCSVAKMQRLMVCCTFRHIFMNDFISFVSLSGPCYCTEPPLKLTWGVIVFRVLWYEVVLWIDVVIVGDFFFFLDINQKSREFHALFDKISKPFYSCQIIHLWSISID